MAPCLAVRAPTTASIPHAYKIPSTTRSLVKSLCRLSRDSLIDLALKWLQADHQPTCAPYLVDNRDLAEEAEEDYLHTPADSIADLRHLYQTFKTEPGSKRDIVDRMLDGDWRRGMSLQQLAMIDFQHLQDHEASLRWTALKLVPRRAPSEGHRTEPVQRPARPPAPAPYPRMHPSAFVHALKDEISPLVQAHYYLHRLPAPHHLTILRLHVADTPYAKPAPSAPTHFTDASRTVYIAFPDSCPYIYIALSGASSGGGRGHKGAAVPKVDVAALKRTVLEAVPKALSRPHERYALEATALTAKNLRTMCALRGNGRGGASQGAFSIFTDASPAEGPLTVVKPVVEIDISAAGGRAEDVRGPESHGMVSQNRKRPALEERESNTPAASAEEQKQVKKRKIDVARRFGTTGQRGAKHRAPIDRLHVQLAAEDGARPEDAKGGPRSTSQATAAAQSQTSSVLGAFAPRKMRIHDPPHGPSSDGAPYSSSHAQPAPPTPTAGLTLTFHGTDVFAGIRTLAEMGGVDVGQMPAWMSGEEGVSTATVKKGVVVDGRGGGA